MKKIRLANIVGARPQFVKAAMLSKAVSRNGLFEEYIVHSGQHFDENMSGVFFSEMEIPQPQLSLNINGGSHASMTGKMLVKFEEAFIDLKPDYVLVYGDTNTSLSAALAAKKMNIPVVHVEAGVRNFDEKMPEEVNRYLIDRMSDINFCCTYLGEDNLRAEGYGTNQINSQIYNCGDLMYDATIYYSKRIVESNLIKEFGLEAERFIICTIHRASNTDDPTILEGILDALDEISREFTVVFPIHPRTRSSMGNRAVPKNLILINPTGYFDMLALLSKCAYVLTDSGGLVREAYFFSKPSIIILKQPLWPELVSAGVCVSSEPLKGSILEAFQKMRSIEVASSAGIFGNGNTADCILKHILEFHRGRIV